MSVDLAVLSFLRKIYGPDVFKIEEYVPCKDLVDLVLMYVGFPYLTVASDAMDCFLHVNEDPVIHIRGALRFEEPRPFEKEMSEHVRGQKKCLPEQDWTWLPDTPISREQVHFVWKDSCVFEGRMWTKYFSICEIVYPPEVLQNTVWLLTVVMDYVHECDSDHRFYPSFGA
jgi:hypothetical protein